MQVVILAGGAGTRISEESQYRPKPMIEVGGMPILWHIMKTYGHYGFHDFIICAGYRQEYIKSWFAEYALRTSDVRFSLATGETAILRRRAEPWNVTVVDTGLNTMTGGRIKRVRPYIGDEPFLMTYGDGVCDVDIRALLDYHRGHGKIATLMTVKLDQSKGVLDIGGDNAV